MSRGSEAINEQPLPARLVTGDDDVYPLGYEPMAEDPTNSQKKGSSTHSSQEEEGEKEEEEGEDEATSPSGRDYRSFILPRIWFMNDFVPKISKDVFGRLRPRFQIPNDIPIRMARKVGKCYTRRTLDIGFYEAIFIARSRLPLIKLHRWLEDCLGVSVYQTAPNAWRILLGAEVL